MSKKLAYGKTNIIIKVIENGKVIDKGVFPNPSTARKFLNKY